MGRLSALSSKLSTFYLSPFTDDRGGLFEYPANRGELYSISIADEMGIKIRQPIQAATPTLPEDLFG